MKKKTTPQKPRFNLGANPPKRLSTAAQKKLVAMKPATKAIAEAASVIKFMKTKRTAVAC